MQVTVNFILSNDEIAEQGGLQNALLACISPSVMTAPDPTADHRADGQSYGLDLSTSPFAGHTTPDHAEPDHRFENVGGPQVASSFPEGVVVDADGLPWDQRIHSSNQKKTATGHWQRRRNLEAGVYERVAGEILAGAGKIAPQFAAAVQSAGAPTVSFPTDNGAPGFPSNAPAISFPTDNGAGAPQVQTPAQQGAAPGTAAAPALGAWTFPRFLKAHAAAVQSGRSNDEAMNSVLQAFNIASLPFLASRPQDIPSVAAALQYEMPQ